jgi:hypothetical protein
MEQGNFHTYLLITTALDIGVVVGPLNRDP